MHEEIEWPYFKIKAKTIKQCMDEGIQRVYDPKWLEKNCYLKLPKIINGKYTIWLELYSEDTQKIMGIETPQRFTCLSLKAGLESICLEYKGEISKYDVD